MMKINAGFISVPFALRYWKIFVDGIIKIWPVAHGLVGICFTPANDIEVAMKFETKFNASSC